MPFDKFDPYKQVEDDPLEASSPSAARRAAILKWGWIVSEGMFFLGLGLMLWWWLR